MTQMALVKAEKSVILLKMAQMALGIAENGDISKTEKNGAWKSLKKLKL
jgi:hypothetical protein